MSSAEVQIIINVLRALIVSQKNPTSIRELLRDYREMEGSPIPFKKFGYQNLEEFLNSSNEFLLINHQGESCVTARPVKETAHISKMIASQKSSKKRKKPTKFTSFRAPSRFSDNNWNKSSYYSNNIYQNKNSNLSKRFGTNSRLQGDSNNNISQNNNRNLTSHSHQQFESNNKFITKSQGLKENDLRNKLNAREQSKPNFDLRSKLDAKKVEIPSLLDLKISKPTNVNLNNKNNLKIEVSNNSYDKNHTKRNVSKTNDMPSKVSVQNRLKVYHNSSRAISPPNSTVNVVPSVASTPSTPSTPNQSNEDISRSFSTRINSKTTSNTESNVTQNVQNKTEIKTTKIDSTKFQFDNTLDPIQSLEAYCRTNKYELPNYEKVKLKTSKQVQCRVNINGVMYSTYPNEYKDMQAAQVALAKFAIEEIKFALSNRNNYPVWSDSDRELASKIYEDIKHNHPHGIFVKALPKIFEESFKTLLPDHWISIINDSNQFLMEDTAGGDKIIFINPNSEIALNLTDCCEELILPWEEKNWYLYVTSCISTVEIWARIVGSEYSENLDDLLNEIELTMLTNKQRPSSITTGKYYLVCLSECWHRVRLERIDKNKGTCRCFFIDFGDEDELPVENLHICDSKFLKLPPQAIVFSLFGLEDFAENPIAKQHLIEILMGKSLVAEIKTKKDLFDKHCDENGASSINTYNLSLTIPKIQIVLYDTSHPTEDIELNPLILQRICDGIPPPELKCVTATNVTITHVTDEGDIFLQIRSTGVFYVQKLIHQLVESKFNEDDNRVTLEDILKPNIFLIKDNEDNKWYRGCLAENKREPNDENYNIFYVDFGITKHTHVSQIFRLESLSAALSKFPKQVIKVKLNNIPNMTKTIVGRIKALLPINYPAIAKLVDIKLDANGNSIPYIIAYVRFERNQGLCNVNEAIKIENELESSSKVSINNFDQTFSINSEPYNAKSITINQDMSKLSIPEPLIPSVGEYFNVFVTVSSNPFNFLVRPYDNFPNFQQDMDKLSKYIFKRDEYIVKDMIQIGGIYVCVADDGICSRVEVEGSYSSQMSCVVRIDYGDIIVIDNSQLRVLPEQFRKIPRQAIKAKLHGIKPINGDWTTEDCLRFRELTVGQKFASKIIKISSENSKLSYKLIELQLIDVQSLDDIYIHQIFVDEKRAIVT